MLMINCLESTVYNRIVLILRFVLQACYEPCDCQMFCQSIVLT